MADAVSPPVAAASAVIAIPASMPWLSELGLDPVVMFWSLAGVVIAQTVYRKTAIDWKAIAGLALGSMFMASVATPYVIAYGVSHIPDGWEWLRSMHSVQLKSLSAAVLGGAAQPILLFAISKVRKSPPEVKEAA